MTLFCIFYALIVFWGLISGEKPHVFTKERTLWLRAVLPFLVILGHVSLMTGIIPEDFDQTGMFAVGIFFFISGYGLELKRHKSTSIMGVRQLPQRLRSLLLPLIVPIVVYCVVLYACSEFDWQALVLSFKNYELILPFTWFVIVLAVFYVAFYTISSVVTNGYKFLITITLVVVLLSLINLMLFREHAYTNFSNLAFPAGVFYAMSEKNILDYCCGMRGRLVITACAVFLVIMLAVRYHLPNILIPIEVLLFTLLVVLLFSVIPLRSYRMVRFFSDISYEVYLCQGITFCLIGRSPDGRPLGIFLLMVFALSTIFAVFCHYLTQLVVKRLYNNK